MSGSHSRYTVPIRSMIPWSFLHFQETLLHLSSLHFYDFSDLQVHQNFYQDPRIFVSTSNVAYRIPDISSRIPDSISWGTQGIPASTFNDARRIPAISSRIPASISSGTQGILTVLPIVFAESLLKRPMVLMETLPGLPESLAGQFPMVLRKSLPALPIMLVESLPCLQESLLVLSVELRESPPLFPMVFAGFQQNY